MSLRRRLSKLTWVVLLGLFLFFRVNGASTILPLNEVKAGMKGIGKSVFEENRIEEFDVEILGVLHNVQPKKDIILARLRGKRLDNAGVISGMSGSP
ncbi:MAG: hypothetical protein ACE5L7_06060, partial [Candidatus Aminicenantales bacterium]